MCSHPTFYDRIHQKLVVVGLTPIFPAYISHLTTALSHHSRLPKLSRKKCCLKPSEYPEAHQHHLRLLKWLLIRWVFSSSSCCSCSQCFLSAFMHSSNCCFCSVSSSICVRNRSLVSRSKRIDYRYCWRSYVISFRSSDSFASVFCRDCFNESSCYVIYRWNCW